MTTRIRYLGVAACRRYGPNPADLPHTIVLEAGLVLHIPELEWHVFAWDAGGYADCLVIYGQVDNIRPEDKSA